jgi:hypothetical protein
MARIKNDVKQIESRLQKHFEWMLRQEIRWNYAFGLTHRYNGELIDENPRNTIDTKNSLKKLRVDISGTVNFKISIKFLDDNAKYIFGEDGHRSDYFDWAMKKLPEYITGMVVEYGLEARLGSKSKQSVREFKKAKRKKR